jgi:hypothetical protein
MIPDLRKVFKRLHFPLEVVLVCARWNAVLLPQMTIAF